MNFVFQHAFYCHVYLRSLHFISYQGYKEQMITSGANLLTQMVFCELFRDTNTKNVITSLETECEK